jgi:hypothetical protein
MARKVSIYDWRINCAPIDQVFHAGGQDAGGQLTLGGYTNTNPEPGGRGSLVMNFNTFGGEAANLDASWTISRITNGSCFRIALYSSVQLVSAASLGVSETGNPWSNGEAWDNGQNWAPNYFAPIDQGALRGSIYCVLDMSNFGAVLRIGHVIGFKLDGLDFTHKIMDVSYSGLKATVEVSPPLRRDLTTDDVVLFRPKALVRCSNPNEVMGTFSKGRYMTFGTARFVEALL